MDEQSVAAWNDSSRRDAFLAATAGQTTTLLSARPHTHNALDDAQEQAELFANLFEWEGPS